MFLPRSEAADGTAFLQLVEVCDLVIDLISVGVEKHLHVSEAEVRMVGEKIVLK